MHIEATREHVIYYFIPIKGILYISSLEYRKLIISVNNENDIDNIVDEKEIIFQ